MQDTTSTKKIFFLSMRTWILIAGILLFMPPLSFLFQLTQDSSFCGSWCPRMFFTWRSGTSGGMFLLGMLRSFMGVALVLGILASTFFLGRLWCSHLCPVGGATELGSRLVPKKFKIPLDAVPAPAVRYGYLSAYLLLPALGLGSLCCSYCNFATVPRLFGAAFSQADMAFFFRSAGLVNLGLLVGLGFLTRGGRGYCNLLCPIGALDSLANRLGDKFGRRMRVDASRCNGCGQCREVCPVWAVEVGEQARINQFSCVPCGMCRTACPQHAVHYGLQKEAGAEVIREVPSYGLTRHNGKDLAL